ncbi:MAG TPA: hypothetical protein VFY89_01700 [Ktedonobacterales bacterium]
MRRLIVRLIGVGFGVGVALLLFSGVAFGNSYQASTATARPSASISFRNINRIPVRNVHRNFHRNVCIVHRTIRIVHRTIRVDHRTIRVKVRIIILIKDRHSCSGGSHGGGGYSGMSGFGSSGY